MKVHLHIERLVVDGTWGATPGEFETAVAAALARAFDDGKAMPRAQAEHIPLLRGTAPAGLGTTPALGEVLGRAIHAAVFSGTQAGKLGVMSAQTASAVTPAAGDTATEGGQQ